MRKILLCAALIAGTLCTTDAQEKISFGVRAGLNINSLSYSGEYSAEFNMKNRIGFHVGAVIDWNVARNVYVQPAVYFTTRGAENEEYKDKYNMNYLQIPVIASYRYPVSNNVKIDVNVGPYVAFGLGGTYKDGDGEEFKIFEKSEKNGCDFKRLDAGLRFGAGVHIKRFYVGLNYDLGLANTINSGEDSYLWENGEKMKNGSFQISVGYNF